MLGNLEMIGLSAVAAIAIGSATAMGSALDASPWRLRIVLPLAVVLMAINVVRG